MRTEAVALTIAIVLGLLHIALQGSAMTRALGVDFNVGNREEEPRLTGPSARLGRASKNFQETFPLFAASVLLALVTDQSNSWTEAGSWLYVWARALYLPLYWAGVRYLRTVVWVAGLAGLLSVLVGALI